MGKGGEPGAEVRGGKSESEVQDRKDRFWVTGFTFRPSTFDSSTALQGSDSGELIERHLAAGIAPPCRNGLNAAEDSRVLCFVKSDHWIRGPYDADAGGTKWWRAGRRGTARCWAVQIADLIERSSRLCHPALRKASGFPASAGASVLLRAGWKAEPSSLRGGGFSGHTPYGKAKPFRIPRTRDGGAAGRRRPDRG
jgi:hypothetical protein